MNVFELVIPKMCDIGLVIDKILEIKLVKNDSVLARISRNPQMIKLIGTTEVEITQHVLLLPHLPTRFY